MKKAKYSSKQIAKWLIDRAARDEKCGGEFLTQLKLQKLLYFAKGFFYVFENQPLFDEKFKARQFGPVLQSVAKVVKGYGREPIKSEFVDESSIDDKALECFLEFIYKDISSVFAAAKLIDFTHNQTPWKETEQGQMISDEAICDYFCSAVKDEDFSALAVTQEQLLLAISRYFLVKHEQAYRRLA